jgi:hypothetical protein
VGHFDLILLGRPDGYPSQESEVAMSDSRRYEEEREGVLSRLFDHLFHGVRLAAEEVNALIHRLGTLNNILDKRQP